MTKKTNKDGRIIIETEYGNLIVTFTDLDGKPTPGMSVNVRRHNKKKTSEKK